MLVGTGGGKKLLFAFGDKRVTKTVEGVDVGHHAGGAVKDAKVVTKEFLGQATYLMKWAFVIEHVLCGVAIAEPVKVGAP